MGNASSCDDVCFGSRTSPAPTYDYEAERRARAEESERRRLEQERQRQVEQQRIREAAERQVKFIRDRDAAAAALKGPTGATSSGLKGISTDNTQLKGSDPYGFKDAVGDNALKDSTGAPRRTNTGSVGSGLKSVERHSRQGAARFDTEEIGKGFDTAGKNSGTLVHPDKQSGGMPAFAATLPEKAKQDEIVKQSLAYYQKLDGLKQDNDKKLAEIRQKRKSGAGDAAILKAQEAALANQNKQYSDDQTRAKETVKKKVKDLGLDWSEESAPGTPSARK